MTYKPKKFVITSTKKLAEDIKLIRVKADMNPKPGQFFQVSVLGVGECPLASCSYNKKYLDILVRKAGRVTKGIFKLKKGDSLFIRGPYGRGYPLEEIKGKNLVLVAGGTGIAPITSLIEYVEENKKDFGNVEIYFGFRNKAYILLKERISRWKKKFKLTITLDNNAGMKKCEVGFVDSIIGKNKIKPEGTLAFLCGPEMMMECVTKKLNDKGIKNNMIFWSLERRMECAMGICHRCMIQDVYVCRDGPVFRYDIIKNKLDSERKANEEK